MQTQNAIKEGTSLAEKFPEIAEEWHPTFNKDLTPEDVLPYTSEKVWWKTKDGREFKSPVKYRTSNYNKRKVSKKPTELSGKWKLNEELKPLLEKSNLAIMFPVVAEEWDYKKNEGLKPDDFMDRSGKRVWWKCKNGHSWQASIMNRTVNGSKCPYCLIEGKRLINKRPDIAKDFDPIKNENINLFDLVPSSYVKVWWKCDNCGNSYEMTVANRSKGQNCPICYPKERKQIPYEKSLEYNYPDLSKEWSKELNGDLTPRNVRPMSGISVWWECKEDKEHPAWQSRIHNRTYNGNRCPTCNFENKQVLSRKRKK